MNQEKNTEKVTNLARIKEEKKDHLSKYSRRSLLIYTFYLIQKESI